jgi:hypothetical protein
LALIATGAAVAVIGLIAAAFLIFGPFHASGSPQPSSVARERVTVTVFASGNHGWVDTGLRVRRGDLLTISAKGRWSVDGPSDYTGPDGYSRPSADNFFNVKDLGVSKYDAITKVAHWGALISYTGHLPPQFGSYTSTAVAPMARRIALVGSNYAKVSQLSGELWLGFNDDAYSGHTVDNFGKVVATITIIPASSRHP